MRICVHTQTMMMMIFHTYTTRTTDNNISATVFGWSSHLTVNPMNLTMQKCEKRKTPNTDETNGRRRRRHQDFFHFTFIIDRYHLKLPAANTLTVNSFTTIRLMIGRGHRLFSPWLSRGHFIKCTRHPFIS